LFRGQLRNKRGNKGRDFSRVNPIGGAESGADFCQINALL
jgi:hypothetical protein